MDRKRFFDSIRPSLFGGVIGSTQVKGIEALLDEASKHEITADQMAYVLAGVHHETGKQMVPVRETFALSDSDAVRKLDYAYARGQLPWVRTPYWRVDADGKSWFGRGRIQNTHKANYEKLKRRLGHDFVGKPDLLLDDRIDAEVTLVGHLEGIWTGKKLSDYIAAGRRDYQGARRIVNGTDKAAMIAGYAEKYRTALLAGGFD